MNSWKLCGVFLVTLSLKGNLQELIMRVGDIGKAGRHNPIRKFLQHSASKRINPEKSLHAS